MNRAFLSFLTAAAILTAVSALPAVAQSPVETHYAPTENLEHIDAQLLGTARKSIDIAVFTFTDFPVMDALADAAKRGVGVRVLLDRSQLGGLYGAAREKLEEVARLPGVEMRIKTGRDLQHLKSYAIDGAVLRTGSANFTASGLKRQNNDLIVIRDARAAGHFEVEFDAVFERGERWP